jgi:hypothetical protein
MEEFDVETHTLREAAARAQDFSARLAAMARQAEALAAESVAHHFPAFPEGRQMAERWEEAKAVFADGIGRSALALRILQERLIQAADGYERADNVAAQRIQGISREGR